jgi:CRP-like cAMP-binding protein
MAILAGNPAHLLASIDLFSQISLHDLDKIALNATQHEYKKNEYVIAVLSKIPYPVTATAVNQVSLLSWEDQKMLELMHQYPQLAINSLSILATRIQEFQDRFREIATERVERRIARALLRLASQTGRKLEHGILIDISLTRQDLAEMTGTTLYTVSRTLSQWEKDGLVSSQREQVTILSPHKLVVLAEDMSR